NTCVSVLTAYIHCNPLYPESILPLSRISFFYIILDIFYPVVRGAIDEDKMMNEAIIEHTTAKDLIAQIQSMRVSDPMYDAAVTVLGEYINHHVQEEQNE